MYTTTYNAPLCISYVAVPCHSFLMPTGVPTGVPPNVPPNVPPANSDHNHTHVTLSVSSILSLTLDSAARLSSRIKRRGGEPDHDYIGRLVEAYFASGGGQLKTDTKKGYRDRKSATNTPKKGYSYKDANKTHQQKGIMGFFAKAGHTNKDKGETNHDSNIPTPTRIITGVGKPSDHVDLKQVADVQQVSDVTIPSAPPPPVPSIPPQSGPPPSPAAPPEAELFSTLCGHLSSVSSTRSRLRKHALLVSALLPLPLPSLVPFVVLTSNLQAKLNLQIGHSQVSRAITEALHPPPGALSRLSSAHGEMGDAAADIYGAPGALQTMPPYRRPPPPPPCPPSTPCSSCSRP